MEIPIRRVDKTIDLPAYKTLGAAALDCAARETVTIPSREVGVVHLNFALKPPQGHFVLMAARSSLHKKGLMLANGVAIFDEDYCGDGDEYRALLYNFTSEPVTVEKGDRITQIIALPYDRIEWKETDFLNAPNRGGIGSTG